MGLNVKLVSLEETKPLLSSYIIANYIALLLLLLEKLLIAEKRNLKVSSIK